MPNSNSNNIAKTFSATTTTIVAALLIASIGGVITLWRDVAVIQRKQEITTEENRQQHSINADFAIQQERVRSIIETLARFRGVYDKNEHATNEALGKQFQLIIDSQQRIQTLAERVTNVEQRLQRLERQSP